MRNADLTRAHACHGAAVVVVLNIEHRRVQHLSSNVALAHLFVAVAATLLDRIRILGAAGMAVLWWRCACVRLVCRWP
jgi:hypothetical protein